MVSRHGVFCIGKHFFVEFLTWTETGIFNFDILIQLETSELDHSLGEVGNLNAFTHIEDENLVTFGHRSGFHYEAASLRDGHKETGDVGMGHCDRTSTQYLFAETGDDTTVGTEDVTETGGDEAGAAFDLALSKRQTEALDVDFSETLGTTHVVGRVDGLIGRDHDHLLDIVFDTLIGHLTGTYGIDQDGFTGIFLHQRYVLVSCGMEDNLWTELTEGKVETGYLTDITDDRGELQIGEFVLEFEAHIVHRGFGVVEHDEFLDTEGGELATEFGTDGTGCTGDHDGLATEVGNDFVHIDLDFRTAEEVFNLHFTNSVGLIIVLLCIDILEARSDIGFHACDIGDVGHELFTLILDILL